MVKSHCGARGLIAHQDSHRGTCGLCVLTRGNPNQPWLLLSYQLEASAAIPLSSPCAHRAPGGEKLSDGASSPFPGRLAGVASACFSSGQMAARERARLNRSPCRETTKRPPPKEPPLDLERLRFMPKQQERSGGRAGS